MNTPTRSALALTLTTLTLSACGNIPMPPRTLPDSEMNLRTSLLAPGKVIYIEKDVLEGNALPNALQNLHITGNILYKPTIGNLQSMNVYIRPTLQDLPSTCTHMPALLDLPSVYVCDLSTETDKFIGVLNMKPNQKVPFDLSGPALDTVAKTGHGYFGVLISSGMCFAGESVLMTDMQAKAHL